MGKPGPTDKIQIIHDVTRKDSNAVGFLAELHAFDHLEVDGIALCPISLSPCLSFSLSACCHPSAIISPNLPQNSPMAP